MKEITTRGCTIEIPSHVSELSPEQYSYYCFLASALASEVITPDFFRVRWFSYLIGLKRSDFTILKPEHIEELDAQLSAVDGFLIEDAKGIRLDFDTVVNLLPEYKGYHGPGDMLQGVTFGEFVECYSALESIPALSSEEAVEAYNQIARILYKIPDSEPVPDLLAFHAPNLFVAVWNAIQGGPLEINGKKIDFRIIFKSAGKSRPDDHTGWTGITFEVASAGLFGSVKEVQQADMWEVLIYLYKCKFEYLQEMKSLPSK